MNLYSALVCNQRNGSTEEITLKIIIKTNNNVLFEYLHLSRWDKETNTKITDES